MTVAVLAVQGAFVEHENALKKLGVDFIELRQKSDLTKRFDGLVLPGGESTVQGKLLKELEMFDQLKKLIASGLPTFATCAGLILLAKELENDDRRYFQTLPVSVVRNAYGRQTGSFFVNESFEGIGKVPMTFIRAPYIRSVEQGVEILSKVDEKIVAVKFQNQLATAFHPELDDNLAIHRLFVSMIEKA